MMTFEDAQESIEFFESEAEREERIAVEAGRPLHDSEQVEIEDLLIEELASAPSPGDPEFASFKVWQANR